MTSTEVRQAPDRDLALVRLARPVTGLAPVPLASGAPTPGDVLRLLGWGATGSLLPLPSSRLRAGLVTVSSATATTVGGRGRYPRPDTSACLFDSGAPYVAEDGGRARLVAVEHDGPACPHAGAEPATRGDTARAWIMRTIGPGR